MIMEYVFVFPLSKNRKENIKMRRKELSINGVSWIMPACYNQKTDEIKIYLGDFLGNHIGDYVGESFFGHITYLICHEHMHRVLDLIGESVEYKKEEKAINHLDFLSGILGNRIRKIYIKNNYSIFR
jgi:hypothetical protein